MTALSLPNGRVIDIEVSGPDNGPVLLFHHGTPGSAVPFRTVQRAAEARGLRLLTCSRPGYGGSTRHAGRSVADVVPDLASALDRLGVERFVTAGWSGGGPHALATAALLPERVAGVLVIAGVAPYDADGLDFLAGMGEDNVVEFGWALRGETVLRPGLDGLAPQLSDTDAKGVIEALAGLLPEVDRACLTDEFGEDSAANFREALRNGIDGWLDDDLAFVRPWGFALEEIEVPAFLWQGDADLMVPFAHGRWLAAHLPGVEAHLLADHGHLSITVGALEEMLDELAGTLGG